MSVWRHQQHPSWHLGSFGTRWARPLWDNPQQARQIKNLYLDDVCTRACMHAYMPAEPSSTLEHACGPCGWQRGGALCACRVQGTPSKSHIEKKSYGRANGGKWDGRRDGRWHMARPAAVHILYTMNQPFIFPHIEYLSSRPLPLTLHLPLTGTRRARAKGRRWRAGESERRYRKFRESKTREIERC